ncbi:MAG: threonine synthase [Deltaproteobacteria bacterium]|nr:threonine synthase [Deltaproteobacteria bacterium]
MHPYKGVIHKYSSSLPVRPECVVTLLEGNTPLLRATRLRDHLKFKGEIFLKFEGLNPTGSFKDRGMTYAVSKALEEGHKAIICASTGNTSASAAAYAAKAGIRCVVLIPKGNVALGKLTQAIMHGAAVIQVRGNFDVALEIVKKIGARYPIQIVNSINPFRLEGQKTAAFEICEVLGRGPDYHFLPVGNAGNITANWRGYKQWHELGKIERAPNIKTSEPSGLSRGERGVWGHLRPEINDASSISRAERAPNIKMMGFQAAGAAPIVRGKVVKNPVTVASAIRIGNPASWQASLEAVSESGGKIDKVTDAEILKAYHLVARCEGYFCEPASAASIAGLAKMHGQKMFNEGEVVVCTLTGHGLKDPETAMSKAPKLAVCEPKMEKIVKILRL